MIGACKTVLGELDGILEKYEGLRARSPVGAGRKMLHRLRFGSKVEELGVVRGKLTTYTSALFVILNVMQLKATGGLETTVETGFAETKGDFAEMRREILATTIIVRARCYRCRPFPLLMAKTKTPGEAFGGIL